MCVFVCISHIEPPHPFFRSCADSHAVDPCADDFCADDCCVDKYGKGHGANTAACVHVCAWTCVCVRVFVCACVCA